MRMVYKKYGDGRYKVYQTDEKGRNVQVIAGDVPPDHNVRRVPVYIELSCDDDRVVDAENGLKEMIENLRKNGKRV